MRLDSSSRAESHPQGCLSRDTPSDYLSQDTGGAGFLRITFDQSPAQTTFALVAVLSLAAHVRLAGIGWDGLAGLHPDERHLFFLTQEMFRALADPAQAGWALSHWWFAPDSPLNPHLGERSFVYGEAPLLAGVLAGWALGATDWFAFMTTARGLSVAVDTAAVLAVFLGARLLAGNAAGLFAAILYAAMPTALQLANFHTVDVWLSAASAAALVPMLALALDRCGRGGPLGMAGLVGVFTGLALASKITGVLLVLPGTLALALAIRRGLGLPRAAQVLGLALLLALVTFRLTHPFAFEGPGFWNLRLSRDWIADFAGLADVTASAGFPPNWQWIAGYGVLRFLRDFTLFGIGPAAAGLFLLLVFHHPRWGAGIIPLVAFFAFLLLAVASSVSALRYAAPGLPALAMALAPAVGRLGRWGALGTLLVALWWGAGAVRLHDGQHPRLAASHWLWTLPRGTVLTNETGWDEALPTILSPAPGEPARWPSHDGWFTFQTLAITRDDSPEKAERMAAALARTDFLILSSDRQSAVMPRLPERFPMTTAHYDALFSGTACFAPVLTIDRGYPLPGVRLDDGWAQEPWRVYDHPIVRIFRREACFDAVHYAGRLKAALKSP